MIELKNLAPNAGRGIVGIGAIASASLGAGMLWGVGGAFLVCGLIWWIDTLIDEVVERFTLIKRGKPE